MIKLKIHRGTKEIGGSCVEISTDNARILLDFGMPLVDEAGNSFNSDIIKESSLQELINQKILPDIKGLYEGPEISGIFISHAHPDHFGFLSFVDPEIPIYGSEVAKSIILEISPMLYGTEYNLPKFNILNKNEETTIGDITVKAHAVDHSIPGSLAFEISHNDKTILYTGDIRAHGRQGYLFKNLIRTIDKVDYLLMEGTTLGRDSSQNKTEEDIEEQLAELFKDNRLNLITFSAQNLDRFISVYKACLKTKKTLVIDPYTAFLLEKFQSLSTNIPQYHWNNIKVYFAPNRITEKLAQSEDLYRYKEQKISIEEILSNPQDYVVKDNRRITSKILELSNNVQIIYSLWPGYLKKEDNYWYKYRDSLIQVHTSGHACIDDLKMLADKINPDKIIPIHTFHPESYREVFGDKILVLQDGQMLEL